MERGDNSLYSPSSRGPARERLRKPHNPPVIRFHPHWLVDGHRVVEVIARIGVSAATPPCGPRTNNVPFIVSCELPKKPVPKFGPR